MSRLLEIERLIALSVELSPRLKRSKLWRRAAQKALDGATASSFDRYTQGAREASLEEEECKETRAFGTDINEQLSSLLKRPLRSTSKSSTEKTNVVKLSR